MSGVSYKVGYPASAGESLGGVGGVGGTPHVRIVTSLLEKKPLSARCWG